MNQLELERLTRMQLLALARRTGIRGAGRLTRARLVERLLAATADSPRASRRRTTARAPKRAPAPPAPRPRASAKALPTTLTELPTSYGQTRLTLLGVDPQHVHAYWEATPADRQTALRRLGTRDRSPVWVLRFYDVTFINFNGANAHYYFDIPVDLAAGSWYVELWSADKCYCAELGPRAANGEFAAVGRSNFLPTARTEVSPRFAPRWLKVEGAFATLETVDLAAEPSPARAERAADRPAATGASAAGSAADASRFAGPSPAAVRKHYEELPLMGRPGAGRAAALTTWGEMPAELPSAGPLPQFPLPPASSEGAGSFSFGGSAWPEAAAVGLQPDAEVTVCGRAQPGRTIQLNGRWVSVESDGTFRARLAVPAVKG